MMLAIIGRVGTILDAAPQLSVGVEYNNTYVKL